MDAPPVRYTQTTDGVRIAYIRAPGSAPPMVIVGLTQGPPAELAARIRVNREFVENVRGPQGAVEFSWRGQGLSGPFTPPLTIEDLARDVEAAVEAAGPEPVDLVAFGTGCFGACAYAARRPERLRSLHLQSPLLFPTIRDSAPLAALAKENYELSVRSLIHYWFDYKEEETARAIGDAMLAGVPLETALAYQSALAATDLRGTLPQIRVPTLLTSEPDPRTWAASAEVGALIPGAQMMEAGGRISAAVGTSIRRCHERFLALEPWSSPAEPGPVDVNARALLSPREREVLSLLAAGRTNQQIADALGISLPTAARHVANIYPKIGASNRAEATAFALRNGLA